MPTSLDHLVFATPDLAAGIAVIEQVLGATPSPGGRHPAWGTRNALLGLGANIYLEIVGPDPAHVGPTRLFDIDRLERPRLVTWAARVTSIELAVDRGRAHGLDLGEIRSGSRTRPDGTVLSWRSAGSMAEREGGVLPFLIDWGGTPHPSASAATGGVLRTFWIEHPEPDRIVTLAAAIGSAVTVRLGAAPALVATIETPRGLVELR